MSFSDSLSILPYSIDSLKQLLTNNTDAPTHLLERKAHFNYFDGYFSALNAKTILAEKNYIDKDYLDDFAGYYVRCFQDYCRKCVRLHFFSITFSEDAFVKLIAGDDTSLSEAKLQEYYLGFIVLKRLPNTVIGRTCLKTYDSDGGKRNFPILRNYHASLFGLALNVKTIAFQEQDNVVAACATSAIWSALQGTGKLFQLPIPSPLEVTKAAREFYHEQRHIPNAGLTLPQISSAIRHFGLEPCPLNAEDSLYLRSLIHAYVQSKIPVILTASLVEEQSPSKVVGLHAIAVTGYGINNTLPPPSGSLGIHLKSAQIDKIYAHDDQVGPFARMEFAQKSISARGKTLVPLSTSWGRTSGSDKKYIALPMHLIVPLYHKIRIPYDVIEDRIADFDFFIESFRNDVCPRLNKRVLWDIRLMQVNDYKAQILVDKELINEHRRDMLLQPLPRFIWVATASHDEKKVLECVFDATDIEQSACFMGALEYDEELAAALRIIANQETVKDSWLTHRSWPILKWFAEQSVS